jgi:hypothetical protein
MGGSDAIASRFEFLAQHNRQSYRRSHNAVAAPLWGRRQLDIPVAERLRVASVNPTSESRRDLDSTVVNIELTLVSIIQGVALFFLTDNARAMMSARNWGTFLYVAAGLCVIFIFWSRSIIHTLTLIKWPLEFGHNFFYIACALGEAILFSRLDRPLAWFQLSAGYAVIVWLLFIYDMRLIRARVAESSNDAERPFTPARADPLPISGCLFPTFPSNLGCAFAICDPDFCRSPVTSG